MRRERCEDAEYDDYVQRLVDARSEGREAGRLNLASSLCPYWPLEPEHTEWQRGRLEAIAAFHWRAA